MKKLSALIFGILILGAGLRIAAAGVPMIPDEIKNLLIAQEISFHPNHLNLPIENKFVTQPLLNLYLTKLGMSLFGPNVLAARFFHVLCGCLTLLLIYRLGKEAGDSVGVTAMFLTAVNPYHIHASVRLVNESLLFGLSAASILVFYMALKHARYVYFIWLGVLTALNFYTKSVSLLLPAVFGIYMLLNPVYRRLLGRKELWIGVVLFGGLLIPWGIWVAQYGTSQLVFDAGMYIVSQVRLHTTTLNFYLIEFLSALKGVDHHMRISWEYATMGMINGIVIFSMTLAAIRYVSDGFVRYMFVIFAVFMGVLSFFAKPGLPFGEFWWASLSLIPAVCLTGVMMVRCYQTGKLAMICVMVFLGYALINSVFFVKQLEAQIMTPPHRMATFVDDDFVVARYYEYHHRKDLAVKEMLRLLRIAPNDVEKLSYLGWLYLQMGLEEKADAAWLRALDLEPSYVDPWNRLPQLMPQRLRYYLDGRSEELQGVAKDMRLGMLYFHAGDTTTADSYFLQIHQQSPNSWAVYYLGRSTLRQGEWDLAEQYFQMIIENSPDFYPAYFYLAQCDFKQGRYTAAEANLLALLENNPDDARAYQLLSEVYTEMKMPQRAKSALDIARTIFHDDVKARIYPRIQGDYQKLFEF